jgi:hypothetical protein
MRRVVAFLVSNATTLATTAAVLLLLGWVLWTVTSENPEPYCQPLGDGVCQFSAHLLAARP